MNEYILLSGIMQFTINSDENFAINSAGAEKAKLYTFSFNWTHGKKLPCDFPVAVGFYRVPEGFQ